MPSATNKIAELFLFRTKFTDSPVAKELQQTKNPVDVSELEIRRALQKEFFRTLEPYLLHHLLATHCGLITVPFCTKEQANFLGFDKISRSPNAPTASNITTLFIGRLPLVPKHNDVALVVFAITGVMPLRVYIPTASSTNQKGKITSPLAQVDVPAEYARYICAMLHRRVFFDQTCFHFAETKDQIRLSHNYGKMLDRNQKARFNHRCRSTISCVPSRQQQGPAANLHQVQRETRNLYNPLCSCQNCSNFLERNSDLTFLHNEYLPFVTFTTPRDIQKIVAAYKNTQRNSSLLEYATQAARKFSLDELMQCHSYLKPEDLVCDVERKHYVEVSAAALWCCRQHCENLWPFWTHATRDGESNWDADLFCTEEFNKRNPNNANNNN